MRVVLNDGTILENAKAGLSGATLCLWIPGMTMQNVAMLMFDPQKTQTIIFDYGEMEDVHLGFTECIVLQKDENQIVVCMEKG